ncbi:MAG: hypothetical protein A2341_13945 [Deltaproteobacteria bacterium RIFOXYB12_FULL_58_9]|nr:MAG: hypothetical protein A2341_13945 [Deltaproteobacteria bacterium RIFOXYB12_FULL_58_9]
MSLAFNHPTSLRFGRGDEALAVSADSDVNANGGSALCLPLGYKEAEPRVGVLLGKLLKFCQGALKPAGPRVDDMDLAVGSDGLVLNPGGVDEDVDQQVVCRGQPPVGLKTLGLCRREPAGTRVR